MPSKPNIILITADSLRYDHLGYAGYDSPTSPNIDAFARQSLVFTQAYSTGPNTPHAFPAIFAAQPALFSERLGLFDAPETLAQALKANGYATIGFNAGNPYVSRAFRYDRGFDEFCDYLDFDIDLTDASRNGAARPYGDLLGIPELELERYVISEEAIRHKAALESRLIDDVSCAIAGLADAPFFLWAHLMDTHYPYLPQAKAQGDLGFAVVSKEENLELNRRVRENLGASSRHLQRIVRLYDAAIRQLDTKVGELMVYLKQRDLFDDSLIVFTADHGEEFLDHGDMQHKSKLFDELLHVPLIIKSPQNRAAGECAELVTLTQLAPTVLAMFGIKNAFAVPGLPMPGLNSGNRARDQFFASASHVGNYTPPADRRVLNIESLPKIYGCRQRQLKLIWDSEQDRWQLFNLMLDPSERRDLASEHPAAMQPLRDLVIRYAAHLEKARLQGKIARLRQTAAIPSRSDALRLSF